MRESFTAAPALAKREQETHGSAVAEQSLGLLLPQYVASGIFSKMTPTNQQQLRILQRTAASAVFDKSAFLGGTINLSSVIPEIIAAWIQGHAD